MPRWRAIEKTAEICLLVIRPLPFAPPFDGPLPSLLPFRALSPGVVGFENSKPTTPGDKARNGNSDGNGPSNGGANGNGRITNKQISAVFSIARQRGMTNTDVRAMAKEMFDRSLDYLTRADGSRLIEQ